MKRLALSAALGLVIFAVSGCGDGATTAPGAPKLVVVTAAYPLAQAINEIGQGNVTVVDVIPPGTDPFSYQVTKAQVAQIRSAGLVVDVGPGFEPSFDTAIQEGRADDVFDTQSFLKVSDPYVWLDPTTMALAVNAIANAMSAANPKAAAVYRSNASTYNQLVSSDGIDFQSTLTTCTRTTIFTADGAFEAMAKDYDIKDEVVGTGTVTVANATSLAASVKAAAAVTVLSEPWVNDNLVDAVGTEAGVAVKSIDTFVGPPTTGCTASIYTEALESDLATLSNALGCDNGETGN